MTEAIFQCKCGFKCVESQLAKSEGACPSCKQTRKDMSTKYGGVAYA